jgi:hypothetical protein
MEEKSKSPKATESLSADGEEGGDDKERGDGEEDEDEGGESR